MWQLVGVFFGDDGDLEIWIERYLGPSYPFGPFIDVYGLLARFVSSKHDGLAKAMDA